jgi:hypothetical protein
LVCALFYKRNSTEDKDCNYKRECEYLSCASVTILCVCPVSAGGRRETDVSVV